MSETRERIAKCAARLAALLPYYESGELKKHTLQEIADICDGVHRSTIFHDLRRLPEVLRMQKRLSIVLENSQLHHHVPKKRYKRNPN
jgi:hypothetical protein